jgi:hypothetical protein
VVSNPLERDGCQLPPSHSPDTLSCQNHHTRLTSPRRDATGVRTAETWWKTGLVISPLESNAVAAISPCPTRHLLSGYRSRHSRPLCPRPKERWDYRPGTPPIRPPDCWSQVDQSSRDQRRLPPLLLQEHALLSLHFPSVLHRAAERGCTAPGRRREAETCDW